MLKKIYQYLKKPKVDYRPLIEVRIFKDALLHNLHCFQKKYPNLEFAPVIKSNAYGHGLRQVAEILDGQGVPFFVADSFYEALTLRQAGINSKILILGFVRPEELLKEKIKNASMGITGLEQLRQLAQNLKVKKEFHLKIDTGMHRQGILTGEVGEAIGLIKSNANIILEGLCSHFADADGPDQTFTDGQIRQWNSVVAIFKRNFPEIKYLHTAATAGTHYSPKIQANVGRLGIGLYGISVSPFTRLDLLPVLEMDSVIGSVRHIPAGEKVGYGATFEAKETMATATVPVGYNEGVDRRLSNRGYFKIGETFCPILGRVSMNISSIDVSKIPDAKIEDRVNIISGNKTDKNSVEAIAKICDCIPYEILIHIPQHLRRIII